MSADPMLVAVELYLADVAVFDIASQGMSDEEAEGVARRTWRRLYDAQELPPITTLAGAAAALRVAVDEAEFLDHFAERMARAALIFLEGQNGAEGAS